MDQNKYPLRGIRVLDFGWVAAGPSATKILADMGAEVIKVESRKRPDTTRFTPDNIERSPETDPAFHSLNRNKLGITRQMANPEGSELLRKLAGNVILYWKIFSRGDEKIRARLRDPQSNKTGYYYGFHAGSGELGAAGRDAGLRAGSGCAVRPGEYGRIQGRKGPWACSNPIPITTPGPIPPLPLWLL